MVGVTVCTTPSDANVKSMGVVAIHYVSTSESGQCVGYRRVAVELDIANTIACELCVAVLNVGGVEVCAHMGQFDRFARSKIVLEVASPTVSMVLSDRFAKCRYVEGGVIANTGPFDPFAEVASAKAEEGRSVATE